MTFSGFLFLPSQQQLASAAQDLPSLPAQQQQQASLAGLSFAASSARMAGSENTEAKASNAISRMVFFMGRVMDGFVGPPAGDVPRKDPAGNQAPSAEKAHWYFKFLVTPEASSFSVAPPARRSTGRNACATPGGGEKPRKRVSQGRHMRAR